MTDTRNERVARIIDADGKHTEVWKQSECHALSYEKCEWFTGDNFNSCGSCPCLKKIPLDFLHSSEAFVALLDHLPQDWIVTFYYSCNDWCCTIQVGMAYNQDDKNVPMFTGRGKDKMETLVDAFLQANN